MTSLEDSMKRVAIMARIADVNEYVVLHRNEDNTEKLKLINNLICELTNIKEIGDLRTSFLLIEELKREQMLIAKMRNEIYARELALRAETLDADRRISEAEIKLKSKRLDLDKDEYEFHKEKLNKPFWAIF